jgi:serine/threonine-protein kinase RsbW
MEKPQSLLELDSQLSELIRVQAWVDELADWQGLGEDTRYAIQLCLEEALANVVLHGYRSEPGHPIVIRYWLSDGILYFAIEDEASPSFAPNQLAPSNSATRPNLESIEPGGNGLRLLHKFAGSLSYEKLSRGNRLTIGFPDSAKKDVSV